MSELYKVLVLLTSLYKYERNISWKQNSKTLGWSFQALTMMQLTEGYHSLFS